MKTISIIAPVIVMLLIGVFCNKTQMISSAGVVNVKKYITQFALPVTIFHAIATADYSGKTAGVFGMMLSAIVIAFLGGYLFKGVVKEQYRKYFPFVITVYEGGMMGYPLYMNLFGVDRLSNIVIIDMAGCVFSFGFYLGFLQLVDSGEKINMKVLGANAIKNPCFVALILGLFLGLTGLMNQFLNAGVSEVYIAIKNMIVSPLSALILLVVGYDFTLQKEYFSECLKTSAIRIIIQSCLLIAILFVSAKFGFDKYMMGAFCLYFYLTPSMGLTSYVKNENANKYIATTLSLYTVVTIVAYIIIAIVMK